jgi:Leucine-rich repeat (LRR) protein
LTGLVYLDLKSNKIEIICTNINSTLSVFSQNELLELIDLSNNRLKTIKTGIFDGILELKYLYLQNNLINRISENAFINLFKLEYLDLSNNFISSIQLKTFKWSR